MPLPGSLAIVTRQPRRSVTQAAIEPESVADAFSPLT